MKEILTLIGRSEPLFERDCSKMEPTMTERVNKSSFLVLGGAGSIGKEVVKEIIKRDPKKLHVVDISENNLVELVRDIRSSIGYITGEFRTFALSVDSLEYNQMIKSEGNYDYVLNLSALKHVRSEEDPFTLMRMLHVNILSVNKTIEQAIECDASKYFCVSSDKATNPVNLMGASKRIMELFLIHWSKTLNISTARFANVAFSDGSLLHSFEQRIKKKQPIVAPIAVKRYFLTPSESGQLCLMSCLLGNNREIFFPKLNEKLHQTTFSEIAQKYLENLGYDIFLCSDEEEARALSESLPQKGKWPCLFTQSDTTGEKDFEEFYTPDETLDFERFADIGVIKYSSFQDAERLMEFERSLVQLRNSVEWSKDDILVLFRQILPDFNHKETGKYLSGKM